MVEYPFEEREKSSSHSVRVFKSDTDQDELKWHRDREDRIVEAVGNTDWMIQLDNELPKPIEGLVKIPRGVWHRVIKGTGDLTVRIDKL
jgi:hypothetical protein